MRKDRDDVAGLVDFAAPRPHVQGNELMVHAGVVPQWTVNTTLELAREVESALRDDPKGAL